MWNLLLACSVEPAARPLPSGTTLVGDLPPTPPASPADGAVAAALDALGRVVTAKGHCPIWVGQGAAWAAEAGVGPDPWGTPYACDVVDAGTQCRSAGPDRLLYTEDDPLGPTLAVGVAPSEVRIAETTAACDAKDDEACRILAMQFSDRARYEPVLAAACGRGDPESCWLLPSWLQRDGAPVDEVRPMLEHACALGVGVACQSWSSTLIDPAAKRAALERGCALNHHWSCEALKSPP